MRSWSTSPGMGGGGGENSNDELGGSFEVLGEDDDEEEEGDDGADDFTEVEGGDSVTPASTSSVGTSSWTVASSSHAAAGVGGVGGVWGARGAGGPSFKDVLARNIDKAATEARLRDPNRRHHHLRVRTKPKFVVADESGGGGGPSSPSKVMKHAHSTGDLTRMLHAVEEGHESSFGQGGRNRRIKKQLCAMMEEDEDKLFCCYR